MTIPATTRRAGPYDGNDSATSFSFAFKVFADTDVLVTVADSDGVETELVLDTDYSVTLNGDQDVSPGGSITYPLSGDPLATGETLVIVGNIDYDQQAELPNGGNFNATVIEQQLDRMAMQIQQLAELVERGLRLSVTSSDRDPELPPPSANDVIGWNASATGLVNVDPATLISAVAYGSMYDDTFTGDGTTAQFTLSEAPGSLANLAVYISGVRQVPGTDYTVSLTTLTFSSAPANGTTILAVYGSTVPTETVLPTSLAVACSDETTSISASATKVTFNVPYAMTITKIFAALSTAQTSGNIFTVDINKNNNTILTTKLTIDNGAQTSLTATTPCVISSLTLAEGDKITIDVDQIGDGTAKGLKVYIVGVPT